MRDDLLGDTERPYGAGLCAVPGCETKTGENALMCRPHWHRAPRAIRLLVLEMWRRWNEGACDLAEFRSAQHAAVDAVAAPL